MKKLMELRITQKVGNFLTRKATVSLPIRILLHEVGAEAVTDVFYLFISKCPGSSK
jgi:hypothetical protein